MGLQIRHYLGVRVRASDSDAGRLERRISADSANAGAKKVENQLTALAAENSKRLGVSHR